MESNEITSANRLDLVAFIGTVIAGLALYIGLHILLHLPQLVVTSALVGVMVIYALSVVNLPRLRVRPDQAGDNSYYLGLIFTLVSMAFALGEFSLAAHAEGVGSASRRGTDQIISNFGIALATTITGIFLRVTLHQMRIDPSDVERATRIELAEASKRVRATLDAVTEDLGRFHDELQQRSRDLVMALSEEATKVVSTVNGELERTTKEMIATVGSAQSGVLAQTQELTRMLGETAGEAVSAIARLRAVEPPPVAVSESLLALAKVLESTGAQTERLSSEFRVAAGSTSAATKGISAAAEALAEAAEKLNARHGELAERLFSSVTGLCSGLDAVGTRLETGRAALEQIEAQSKRSAGEALRAQEAAVEVLARLTDLTRGLAALLKEASGRSGHGTA